MKKVLSKTLIAGAISTAMLAGAAQAAVTLVSWGGGYSASQQKAYIDTYSSGEVNMISYNGGLGEVRAQVESGNVQWDIVDVLPSQARTGCDEGLFEELDRSLFLPAPDGTPMDEDLMVDVPNDCVVPQIWWSYVPFHHADTFKGEQPSTIQDFFDVEKFPGKRGIHTWASAITEMALYADGVAIADIYDVLSTQAGQDRAFAKLDTIKDVVVFWDGDAEPLELVKSGEVAMSIAYNGRAGAAILSEGASFDYIWDGQVLDGDWIAIVKGSPNKDEAIEFLKHATTCAGQAEQAKYITYGPMRTCGLDIIKKGEPWFHNGIAVLPHMPNTKKRLKKSVLTDPVWWADHNAELKEQWSAWMAGNK